MHSDFRTLVAAGALALLAPAAAQAQAPATPAAPVADEDAPAGAAQIAVPADPVPVDDPTIAEPKQDLAEPDAAIGGFAIDLSGYLRAQYTFVQDDERRTDFVGRNDGFSIANARFIIDAARDDVRARLSFDGAVDRRDERNTAKGEVRAALKDAYVAWEPFGWLNVRAGQFKPPFDAEELQSTADLLFIDRAVESRGVHGVEGFNVDGLSLERQAGVMLYSAPLMLEDLPLGAAYYLSASNGSGANRPLNDNDALALTGRLEVFVGDWVTVGGGVFYDQATTGDPPDLLDEDRLGIAADIGVEVHDLLLFAQFMQVRTEFPDVPAQPDRVARGYHAEIGYRLPWGLIPAYRYAFYDPTTDFEADDPAVQARLETDELTYHTFGLTWLPPGVPLKLQVNYTLTLEDEPFETDDNDLDNDRVDALVQATF